MNDILIDKETYNEILGTLQILSNLVDKNKYPQEVKDGFELLNTLITKQEIEEFLKTLHR